MTDSAAPDGDAVSRSITDGGTAESDESNGPAPPERPSGHGTTVIVRTVVRVTVPIILVTAIALLLQGHNQPGGGFIGGVLTATAFVLVYVVFGLSFLQWELLEVRNDAGEVHHAVELYRLLFAVGLAFAFASGLVPLLNGLPFLTQGVLFLDHLPLYGELEVGTALAFDLGVYLAVVGGLLTVIAEVGSE